MLWKSVAHNMRPKAAAGSKRTVCPFLKIVPSNNKKHEELQQLNNNNENDRAALQSIPGVQELLYESPDVSCGP